MNPSPEVSPTPDQIIADCAALFASSPAGGLSARPWDSSGREHAGKIGLGGLYAARTLGGAGLDLSDAMRVFEVLGSYDGEYALGWSVHNAGTSAICKNGSPQLQNVWAADLTAGRKMAGFALSEQQSGSNPVDMRSTGRWNKDGSLTLNGRKAWVSLAGVASIFATVVKMSETPGHRDMIMVAIPADAPGVSFGPAYKIAGMHHMPVADMLLDNVTIPADHILLEEGKGLSGALFGIDIARTCVASASCGLIENALKVALDYARARQITGAPSLELDAIQRLLGDVATDLELARLISRKAANALGTPDGPRLVAHAKLFAPDAALRAVSACSQAMGGAGLLAGSGLEKMLHMAQVFKVVDGTSEVQRKIIGRSLR